MELVSIALAIILQTKEVKNVNLGNHSNNHSIITGDSSVQIDQIDRIDRRERESAEREQQMGERLYQSRGSSGKTREEVLAREKTTSTSRASVNQTNPYKYGYCTWYVAQRKGISTNYGNAKNWPINSDKAEVNAVVIMRTSDPRGHVAYVEAVERDEIVVSHMNWSGWNKVVITRFSINDPRIRGYSI